MHHLLLGSDWPSTHEYGECTSKPLVSTHATRCKVIHSRVVWKLYILSRINQDQQYSVVLWSFSLFTLYLVNTAIKEVKSLNVGTSLVSLQYVNT